MIENMEKIAEYEVERMTIYASSGTGRGTVKTLSVWRGWMNGVVRQGTVYMVQIGNGKMHFCHKAENHEELGEFWFGNTKPQRWAKI